MAKKQRRKRSRKNPSDTLLVNPQDGGKSRSVKRKRAGMSLFGRFKRALGIKRNPLLANPKRRKVAASHKRSHAKRKNPLLTNPLLANPKHRKGSHKRSHAKRRNPLLTNPLLANPKHRKGSHKGKHGVKRRNPSGMLAMPGKAQKSLQKIAGSLPLVGGLLGGAIGVIGGAVGGALGVLPTAYAMPYVAKYVPAMLKPYGYSIAGALLSSAVRMIPMKLPYKAELAVGIAAAGGAVDMYRWQHGRSQDLGDEYGDDDYGDDVGDDVGDDDMGDVGDDGSAFAAIEYADADLADAEYMGDDLSSDEIAAADLGRRGFWQRFRPKRGDDDEPVAEGVSEHAGKEGRRHGFLIYWIGFDNFRRFSKLPSRERQDFIAHMKGEAGARATKLLGQKLDTSVQQAETHGLLVAA